MAGAHPTPDQRERSTLPRRRLARRGRPSPSGNGQATSSRNGGASSSLRDHRAPATLRRWSFAPAQPQPHSPEPQPVDSYLLDYLRSGTAWLLVGSGPSTAMGYPDWRGLAEHATTVTCIEGSGHDPVAIRRALAAANYPFVFSHAKRALGLPRLRQILAEQLRPQHSGEIYQILARWPVPVYLTTNFDDEISTQLTALAEPYNVHGNSADHFAHLHPDASGIICKLHGDLRTDGGLVLTSDDYTAIASDPSYSYWHTKLTAIFTTQRVIVVGHSLADPDVRHVLAAAKHGAGVERPVCWIAPDVPPDLRRDYLARWRVRVLSYDNHDGDHRSLLTLLRHLDDFVPPRTAVPVRDTIAAVAEAGSQPNAAAPGYFVFNNLHAHEDFETKRVDVILAAVQSAATRLASEDFDILTILQATGWPSDVPLPHELRARVIDRALETNLLLRTEGGLRFTPEALQEIRERQTAFEDARDRFLLALVLRLKKHSSLDDNACERIAGHIEASLIGYFRESGITLASLLQSSHRTPPPVVPTSIVSFLTQSSARYSEQAYRQAFCTVSLDIFLRPGLAERAYLGRVSQGFCGYHMLGAFGQAAAERLRNARDTVWLVDSNVQISLLAIGASGYQLFRECLERLRSLGLRFFTTTALAEETAGHLAFANAMVARYGEDALEILALGTGQPPFDRANTFAQGFIRWRAASNAGDWRRYVLQVCGPPVSGRRRTTEALRRVGIEEIPFEDWPGFDPAHTEDVRTYTAALIAANARLLARTGAGMVQSAEPDRKSPPEAEAAAVVRRERLGDYHTLSSPGVPSPAWFISNTTVLNTLANGETITWRPEAFVRFASTLFPESDRAASDRAFDTLIWSVAQAGLIVVEENVAEQVFGRAIDQAAIDFRQEKEHYAALLSEEYPDIEKSFLTNVPVRDRPVVHTQLAFQAAMKETQKREAAEAQRDAALQEKKLLEAELAPLRRFAKKLQKRSQKAKRRKRRDRSRRQGRS